MKTIRPRLFLSINRRKRQKKKGDFNNIEIVIKRIEKWVKKESYGKLKGLGFQISFKDIYLNDIKEKNYYIKEKYFICSIYCDNEEASFNKIELIG